MVDEIGSLTKFFVVDFSTALVSYEYTFQLFLKV